MNLEKEDKRKEKKRKESIIVSWIQRVGNEDILHFFGRWKQRVRQRKECFCLYSKGKKTSISRMHTKRIRIISKLENLMFIKIFANFLVAQ